jgi:hypothetical protein
MVRLPKRVIDGKDMRRLSLESGWANREGAFTKHGGCVVGRRGFCKNPFHRIENTARGGPRGAAEDCGVSHKLSVDMDEGCDSDHQTAERKGKSLRYYKSLTNLQIRS